MCILRLLIIFERFKYALKTTYTKHLHPLVKYSFKIHLKKLNTWQRFQFQLLDNFKV